MIVCVCVCEQAYLHENPYNWSLSHTRPINQVSSHSVRNFHWRTIGRICWQNAHAQAYLHENFLNWSLSHTQSTHQVSSHSIHNFHWLKTLRICWQIAYAHAHLRENASNWSLWHTQPTHQISSHSVCNFLRYPTDRKTNKKSRIPDPWKGEWENCDFPP